MFTGLVEDTGRVVALEYGGQERLVIDAGPVAEGVQIGDSILVNGACLTVNDMDGAVLVFYTMPETLRRTALGGLREGDRVNLERAMAAGARFGGHIVQGHVDGVGEVMNIVAEGDAEIWEFSAPRGVLGYLVEKGSVCVDGISLTVVSVGVGSFTVSILPQTKAVTNLRSVLPGGRVNLEADVIAKYVERLLEPRLGNTLQTPERSVEDAV